ncbi:MAG: hypothetical protein OEV01_05070 [Nitrospira sp.]|nr:hypothetical protein [Nitrospira sp.]MDH4303229.1 hypothetical protein [Nitrospira sp.]
MAETGREVICGFGQEEIHDDVKQARYGVVLEWSGMVVVRRGGIRA